MDETTNAEDGGGGGYATMITNTSMTDSSISTTSKSTIKNSTISSDSSSALPPPLYQEGTKIFCTFRGLPYEGVILDVLKASEVPESLISAEEKAEDALHNGPINYRYLIHYTGWKSRWDARVGEYRLLLATEENREWAKEIKKEHKELMEAEGRSVSGKRIKKKAKKKRKKPPANKKKGPLKKGTPAKTNSKIGEKNESTLSAAVSLDELKTEVDQDNFIEMANVGEEEDKVAKTPVYATAVVVTEKVKVEIENKKKDNTAEVSVNKTTTVAETEVDEPKTTAKPKAKPKTKPKAKPKAKTPTKTHSKTKTVVKVEITDSEVVATNSVVVDKINTNSQTNVQTTTTTAKQSTAVEPTVTNQESEVLTKNETIPIVKSEPSSSEAETVTITDFNKTETNISAAQADTKVKADIVDNVLASKVSAAEESTNNVEVVANQDEAPPEEALPAPEKPTALAETLPEKPTAINSIISSTTTTTTTNTSTTMTNPSFSPPPPPQPEFKDLYDMIKFRTKRSMSSSSQEQQKAALISLPVKKKKKVTKKKTPISPSASSSSAASSSNSQTVGSLFGIPVALQSSAPKKRSYTRKTPVVKKQTPASKGKGKTKITPLKTSPKPTAKGKGKMIKTESFDSITEFSFAKNAANETKRGRKKGVKNKPKDLLGLRVSPKKKSTTFTKKLSEAERRRQQNYLEYQNIYNRKLLPPSPTYNQFSPFKSENFNDGPNFYQQQQNISHQTFQSHSSFRQGGRGYLHREKGVKLKKRKVRFYQKDDNDNELINDNDDNDKMAVDDSSSSEDDRADRLKKYRRRPHYNRNRHLNQMDDSSNDIESSDNLDKNDGFIDDEETTSLPDDEYEVERQRLAFEEAEREYQLTYGKHRFENVANSQATDLHRPPPSTPHLSPPTFDPMVSPFSALQAVATVAAQQQKLQVQPKPQSQPPLQPQQFQQPQQLQHQQQLQQFAPLNSGPKTYSRVTTATATTSTITGLSTTLAPATATIDGTTYVLDTSSLQTPPGYFRYRQVINSGGNQESVGLSSNTSLNNLNIVNQNQQQSNTSAASLNSVVSGLSNSSTNNNNMNVTMNLSKLNSNSNIIINNNKNNNKKVSTLISGKYKIVNMSVNQNNNSNSTSAANTGSSLNGKEIVIPSLNTGALNVRNMIDLKNGGIINVQIRTAPSPQQVNQTQQSQPQSQYLPQRIFPQTISTPFAHQSNSTTTTTSIAPRPIQIQHPITTTNSGQTPQQTIQIPLQRQPQMTMIRSTTLPSIVVRGAAHQPHIVQTQNRQQIIFHRHPPPPHLIQQIIPTPIGQQIQQRHQLQPQISTHSGVYHQQPQSRIIQPIQPQPIHPQIQPAPPAPPQIIYRRRLTLALPPTLATILAEDRKFVQQQYMTPRIPSPTLTVKQLLAELEKNRVEKLGGKKWGWLIGERFLRTYFNTLINGSGNLEGLLYNSSERAAHERLKEEIDAQLVLGLLDSSTTSRLERTDPDVNQYDFTAYYGPVHLLRLFGLLQTLLAEAKLVIELSEFAIAEMVAYFGDVLAYLDEHRTELFGPGHYESSYSALVGMEIQRALAGGDHQ